MNSPAAPNIFDSHPTLVDVSRLRLPIRPTELFHRPGECVLEIGSGEGEFLVALAAMRPQWNLLGLEIKRKRVLKAARLAVRTGASNVRFIPIDAAIAVRELFRRCSFGGVYINFPDPWPKERHKKHRLINTAFIADLARLLEAGGFVDIATDHAEYVCHIQEAFASTAAFRSRACPNTPHGAMERPKTKYERTFIEEGRKLFYLRYEKA